MVLIGCLKSMGTKTNGFDLNSQSLLRWILLRFVITMVDRVAALKSKEVTMQLHGRTSLKFNHGIGQTIRTTFEWVSLIYQTRHRHISTFGTTADLLSTFCLIILHLAVPSHRLLALMLFLYRLHRKREIGILKTC